jgi:microcystin-dependent protein
MDEYIGTIRKFALGYETINWMLCHGQTLPISEYEELYSLIGYYFGGDPGQNFKLPDLREKDSSGNYYTRGQITGSGERYTESFICVEGIFPTRD